MAERTPVGILRDELGNPAGLMEFPVGDTLPAAVIPPLPPEQVGADPAGTAAGLMADHEHAADPHPQYATPAEAAAAAPVQSVNGQTGDVSAATVEQGARADSAVQPDDLAAVATTGAYSDLSGVPSIPAAPADIGAATAEQGAKADTAVQPGDLAAVATSGAYADLSDRPSIPAEPGDIGAATAAQGALADSAVQPEDLAAVATSGDYSDLSGRPALGSAAAADAGDFATAAQGALAGTAVQPGELSAALAGKVDTVPGMGLSEESYTSGEKTKLAGVAPGATANTRTDDLVEGAANLYHTPARVRATTLAGLDLTSIAHVSAGDSVLTALGKLAARARIVGAPENYIGPPGGAGFGVGICPAMPAGFTALPGTFSAASSEYGNYQYSDGSVMVWLPAFFYRIGHADNPTYAGYGVNSVDVLPLTAFSSVAAANAAGYALHRAFYDNGQQQPGVFVDKYLCSNNSGVASSIALGNPLSSHADHNPFAGLTGAPTNAYHGAIAAAKTRGADFFPSSLFIHKALALLSLVHAQAARSSANCAWYDAAGVANFPKGCNNNALRDVNDTSVQFAGDGYSTSAKTGSGVPFAKTTHNGQACGVADLNGCLWEITLGLTVSGGTYRILKTSARMASLTNGTTTATDAWGATGVAANYDDLGASFESLTGAGNNPTIGSAAQVLSPALSGNAWAAAGAGVPLAGGVGGSNLFGNDGLNNPRPDQMCPLAGGDWGNGSRAGVWALSCNYSRTTSSASVGFRAALYL
ncbi:hypothetical protein D9M68_254140 [compost metagenome]